ncbi:serine/threonine dehydratase [Halobacteriales archaeon QH_10_67_13]|nr:MAG: serine/threonine dehydratase [Halobacteriales archaeon QH_10_67_13]
MAQYEPVESPDASTLFPYHDPTPPTLADVYAARRTINGLLPETPLVRADGLSAALDAEVYLKREDTLPTGAFKVRGGLALVAGLEDRFRDPGLIAASTGNHGGSVAYAADRFDVPATIVVPEDTTAAKVDRMERLGATVELHRGTYDQARERAEARARVEYLFCPVGGGSSAAGYAMTVGRLTDATVVGVQSERAPAVHRAWADGTLEPHDRVETFAEGIATRVPFALPVEVLRADLDEFLLVTDDALRRGVKTMFERERIVLEGACAASLAGARAMADEIAGSTVVLQVSGRNVDPDLFRELTE